MRNITLSADEQLIEEARAKAHQKKTTLNAEFRKWLAQYTDHENDAKKRIKAYRQLMSDYANISTDGQQFSRDDMNER